MISFINDFIRTVSEAKYKSIHVEGFKILTPKQMLQILAITFAQAKADSTSKSLLNDFRKIIYSLYQRMEITKKIYSDIMNQIK